MLDIGEIFKGHLKDSQALDIEYSYDAGLFRVDGKEYEVGNLSFSEVGQGVLGTLKEMYGEYETIPYTFNSEAYENAQFRAEVLALGSAGLLRFKVEKKDYQV